MDFKGPGFGNLWQPVATCGTGVLAPKEEVSILEARIGGSNIRVLEARGLAGLARLAGRRMEQRSLARSMLWRDRRILGDYLLIMFPTPVFKLMGSCTGK